MESGQNNTFEKLAGPLHALSLDKIQVNLGRLCNLYCNHCHLDASPGSPEIMPWNIMQEISRVAREQNIRDIDITGGAPELNPNLKIFINSLSDHGCNIQLRTNLVALMEPEQDGLAVFLRDKKINIVASLPCYQEENVIAQRGSKTFQKSINALIMLNNLGYGKNDNLKLELVFNPGGPFLPPRQEELETLYRKELKLHYGISFNNLLVITNMPVGRFRNALKQNNQLTEYMNLLKSAFNNDTLSNVMCKTQVSVGWDGSLYDCDFNLALDMKLKTDVNNISEFKYEMIRYRTISTGEHCFGCTAGAGSSCGGALNVG